MELVEAIQDKNIRLKSYATGNHRTLCPECSHTRKKKTDPCLSVTIGPANTSTGSIDAGEFMAHCHNCDWATGFTKPENQPDNHQPNNLVSGSGPAPKLKPKIPVFVPQPCEPQTVKWFAKRLITEDTLLRNQVAN